MTPREEAQAIIRAELDRHRPMEVSRRTLELIAEMSLRFPGREDRPAVEVVDEAGATRMMERDGRQVPMDLPALVAEIRQKHPALFESGSAPVPAAPATAAATPEAAPAPASAAPARSRIVETPAAAPSPAPARRDWLMLRDKPARGAASPNGAETPAKGARPNPIATAVGRVRASLPGMAQAWHARARLATDAVAQRVDTARAAIQERRARIVETPRLQAAGPAPSASAPARGLNPATQPSPRLTPYLYGFALLLAGLLAFALWPDGEADRGPATNAVAQGAARPEPEATGAVPPRPEGDGRVLRGVPEVVDTVTLRLEGRIVKLFGVEWARGGQQDDLVNYLRNRQVECRIVEGSVSYRCVVDGQDLSRVVLFNGGGRTTAEATQELLQAEDRARDQRLGVWKR